MSRFDVIRAWKDVSYRESLSAEELASIPEHPASFIELDEAELGQVQGGDAEVVADGDTGWPVCTFGLFSISCCLTQNGNITSCGAGCR